MYFLMDCVNALFFSCWEFTRTYGFFGCISLARVLARVFILRVSEFYPGIALLLYFLAVDFIILRESFSINFSLCFFFCRKAVDGLWFS